LGITEGTSFFVLSLGQQADKDANPKAAAIFSFFKS
jgi:hypothetical protein